VPWTPAETANALKDRRPGNLGALGATAVFVVLFRVGSVEADGGGMFPCRRSKVQVAMNPLKFVDEVRQEVSKVTWPTAKEVWVTTVMVLIMVTLCALFFLAADQLIGTVVQYVLSLGR
jgi:preprotein translocase subunit SecE